jgi:hypothetical protein
LLIDAIRRGILPRKSLLLNRKTEHIILLIKTLKKTKSGNYYIIVAINYIMKWLFAKAILNAIAKTLAKFLYKLYSNYRVLKEIIIN